MCVRGDGVLTNTKYAPLRSKHLQEHEETTLESQVWLKKRDQVTNAFSLHPSGRIKNQKQFHVKNSLSQPR